MTEPVNVPGAGKVPRRTVFVVGGVAALGLGVLVIYRRRRAKLAAAATVDTTTGTLNADGTYQNPAPVVHQSTIDTTGGAVPTSNDQWAQKALTLMSNWDPIFVQTALGKFLAGQPLTSDEANAVRVAEALAGPPPVGNLTIVMQTTASAPGADNTPAPTTPAPITVPDTLTPPVGANLYDWTYQVSQQYHISLDLNSLRALNGGMAAFDRAHIQWTPVPGPPNTPKLALFKNPAPLRIK
jgi:hypothetical protein